MKYCQCLSDFNLKQLSRLVLALLQNYLLHYLEVNKLQIQSFIIHRALYLTRIWDNWDIWSWIYILFVYNGILTSWIISKAVTLLEKRHRVFASKEPIRIRVTVF